MNSLKPKPKPCIEELKKAYLIHSEHFPKTTQPSRKI